MVLSGCPFLLWSAVLYWKFHCSSLKQNKMILVLISDCSYLLFRIAKNLFKMLHEAKEEQRKLKSTFLQPLDGTITESPRYILGKHYHRKTRFREPIVHMKLLKDGLFSIYSKLNYTEMKVSVCCK